MYGSQTIEHVPHGTGNVNQVEADTQIYMLHTDPAYQVLSRTIDFAETISSE